ncbi:sensor histidine kinase [Aerosakkonema funiforme]|uniref:histidine kinase n=2 Tax=Oscillatoriophycideae TaxID=1301283 RepID=A0A926VJY8_9CYAN|nr:PAS domain-containing sensor histidine kinase [Aerosakkonema funiforme]MBD2185267.1 PAS domain S-box protein [Aerosakkonema funiforme FACHB-1375]
MIEEIFDRQIAASLQRLEMLWQRTDTLPKSPRNFMGEIEQISDRDEEMLLRQSLDELTFSLEELQVASEELRDRNQELATVQMALETERRRYQDLFDFAPDAYLVTNPEGVILEANQAAANLLNVRSDRIVGKPLVVFVPESARRDFRTQLFQRQNGQELRDWEVEIQPQKGQAFPAACTIVPVQNSHRQVVALRWQLRDITKLKQAEQVEQKLQMLDAILHASPIHLYVIDQTGKCIYASPEAARSWGKVQTDIVGKRWQDIGFPAHTMVSFDLQRQEVLRTGQSITGQISFPFADGIRYCEYTISLMQNLGSFVDAVVLTVKDITKHKQTEAEMNYALATQKELNRMKANFLSVIAQEFRTPLTNIIASAELVKIYGDKWSTEKKNQHLEQIRSAVQQTNQVLNDILLVFNATAGKLQFNPALLDLEKFCREQVEFFQPNAKNGCIITFSSQGNTSACLDKQLLRSILTNLLSNAIEYSPQGGQIKFDLICENREAIFCVKYEDSDVTKQERKQLFDLLYIGSDVGNIDGIGLELSIVQQCVDLHGGKITLSSEVGAQTVVTVTLPLRHLRSSDEQKPSH